MRKIAKNNLPMLYSRLVETMDLFLPIKAGKQANFKAWQDGVNVDFDILKTGNTPKEFFLPQVETLYETTMVDGNITIEPADTSHKQFVVFGVRACDEAALGVLDNVYLQEPIDRFYEARRNRGHIITMACGEPKKTCFCSVFGIDATKPLGDVSTWLVGDTLYWQALTEKGEKLTEMVSDLLENANESAVKSYQNEIHEKIKELPYAGISIDTFSKNSNLLELFDDTEWNDIYKACIGCGTCTFICPTCQCYDIKDFDAGDKVKRYRCWDSCMYSDFTLMAHGNPRTSQKERFRQRFMHKLVYHPENHKGQYSCVGCGRCINKCPASMNIIKVIKRMGGVE